MSVIDHSCPSCGASLDYNSCDNNWVCKFCKVKYSLEMLKSNIDKYNSISSNELDEYECSNCGSKVVTDKSTSSTKCIYCNSSVIIKSSLVGNYKPDYIVPFSNTKEEILDKFSKHLKSKLLCGKQFKNIKNITSISSLYVPYWLVSSDVLASVKGSIFGGENGNGSARRYYRLGEMKLVDVPADAKSNLDNNLLSGIMSIDYTKMPYF